MRREIIDRLTGLFRTTGTLDRDLSEDVQRLLDLIAADRRIEVPVEDYRRYAPIERDFELPVEGPGVWAVAVTADELRATTLVLRSDVEVVVKSSRREVFVFAQDMFRRVPR